MCGGFQLLERLVPLALGLELVFANATHPQVNFIVYKENS